MTSLPSAKPCYFLRREHLPCLKPFALHEKSCRNQKNNQHIQGFCLKS